MTPFDVIVPAGGAARRLGGVDKPGLTVGETTLLDRVLTACAGARTTVVVGPARPTTRTGVRWTRERPPGGGPVAAVAAGLAEVTADAVLLFAADLPFLDERTVRRLAAALAGADRETEAVVMVDAAGRDQPLAAAYRTAALRTALAALGEPAGLPLRRLTGGLRTLRLADTDDVTYDCDTWEDLERARERERG
ncbi:NTP transferase domain-containing protein [Kitasatospora sp. NPDC056181]|uniref:molybdenum cofactor guanylyltransferase n=1 Tax=Kitasatospora sp. NPDC056181 TaxID=3345737 RepID=UPI001ADF3435|nr:NTP transferase domain-containing protein [Kitasatospora sp. RG8]